MSLSKQIRINMAKCDMKTHKDLHEATGISMFFISKILRDKANPSVNTVRTLAKALNCTASDLLKEEIENES